MTQRVWDRIDAGHPAVGTYCTVQDPVVVGLLADAGLDFVRFDPCNVDYGDHLPTLMDAAHDAGLTVWVRVENDPERVAEAAALRADIVTIPDVHSAAQVEAAIAAAAGSAPDGHRTVIGGQIEDVEGLTARDEIVAVDGLGVVHSGRNDLSKALGVPGQPFHPDVLAAEEQVVAAAVAAGKHLSLHHPLTEEGIRRARAWRERGITIFSFDRDRDLLARSLRTMAGILDA